MFCTKCGTQIPQDGMFCINCGTPVNNASPAQSTETDITQAASGSSFGTYYSQSLRTDQSLSGQQPKKKKTKIIVIAAAGVVLAVALAAFLLLTVFNQSEGWPFSGKTVQTRFVNDSIAVFDRAFGDINFGKMDEIGEQPFDYNFALDITSSDKVQQEMSFSCNFAYDEQTLGCKTTQEEGSTTLLLSGDTLYMGFDSDILGEVFSHNTGIKFGAKADLSKPMSLDERINALFFGSEIDIDLIKLFELFFDSISEDCFDKNTTRTMLKMDSSDLAQMLNTFAGKLSEDEELNDSLKDVFKELTGTRIDISSMMPLISLALKSTDIELVWAVRYDDAGLPRRVEISAEDNGSIVFDFGFEAQRQDDTRDILMDISIPNGYQNISLSVEMEFTTQPENIEYNANITANGMKMSMQGFETWDGYDCTGSIEFNVPMQNIDAKASYSGSLSIGKPSVAVDSDERFAIDTENAEVLDLTDIFSMPSQGLMPSI